MMVCMSIFAFGVLNVSAERYDDYLYYTVSGDSVTITDCDESAITVEIPSIIDGKPVTKIDRDAFSFCINLKSITIPDSVTSIGYRAFYGCSSLTSVIISESVRSIENSAFYNCPISITFYAGSKDKWIYISISRGNDTLKRSTIVYNAVKKTYKFVTNCDSVLPDITDYAVISLPVVENGDKTFLGWYNNENLFGTPLTFPYYGNAPILYAAWADRTGTSFDNAFEADANQQYTVAAADSEQMIYYEFTPKATGKYGFYTKGNVDTYGYLYDSKKQLLTADDNSGENNNFKIAYSLTAGEKYYIAVKCCDAAGTFTFVTEADCSKGTKTVCVTAVNGESIFVTIPNYLPQNAQIILACYEKGKLIKTLSSPNKDETIYFVVDEKFDLAKVMVWESLENMKPVCDAEIVK